MHSDDRTTVPQDVQFRFAGTGQYMSHCCAICSQRAKCSWTEYRPKVRLMVCQACKPKGRS